MNADEFNRAELTAGRLTMAHVSRLARFFQDTAGLEADGKIGAKTRELLDGLAADPTPTPGERFLANPLPELPDGRKAQITSEYRPKDRPNHDGVDWFYRWAEGDLPATVGDHAAAGRTADGKPKWVVPFGVKALAAGHGTVSSSGNTPTGFHVWIDHGNGYRSGYFHLLDLRVHTGELVTVGQILGLVGDNPRDNDGRHLHFELSPVDRYAPIDPAPHFVAG